MEMKPKNVVGRQAVVAKALCVGSILTGSVTLSASAQAPVIEKVDVVAAKLFR